MGKKKIRVRSDIKSPAGACCEGCASGSGCIVNSSIPGGQFTARENPDGTYNVMDVPIFAEHTVKTPKGEEFRIDREWMSKAIKNASLRRSRDNYLAPCHINHHGTGRDVQPAGFFLPKHVDSIEFEGREVDVMFADLVAIPRDVYQKIKQGGLPFRSVESHRITSPKPEIDSLALMADEVPFFRLSLLTIGKEIPFKGAIGKVERRNDSTEVACAYRSLGIEGCALLFNLDGVHQSRNGDDMRKKYSEADRLKKAAPSGKVSFQDEEEMEAEEELIEEKKELLEEESEEQMMANGDKMEALRGMLQEMLALLEESPAEESEEEAPAPVEMSSPKGQRYSQRELKEIARGDALESRLNKLETRVKIDDAIKHAIADLERCGYEGSLYSARLKELANKDGIGAMKTYAAAIKEHVDPDPPASWSGEQDGRFKPMSDVDIQPFSALGADSLEAATKYAKEYDDLASRGLAFDFSKQEHVKACLEADGIDVSRINLNGRS